MGVIVLVLVVLVMVARIVWRLCLLWLLTFARLQDQDQRCGSGPSEVQGALYPESPHRHSEGQ